MIGIRNLTSLTQRLNQLSENGRFQVTSMGSPSQSVTYVPANSQGTESFSEAMSAADDLTQLMRRTGDLVRFAKAEDQEANSRDINPEPGKVVLGKLEDGEVDTGFSSKKLNQFNATSLVYEPASRDGSDVIRGYGMEGLKTLDFEYQEKYERGKLQPDHSTHETYRIGVKQLAGEDIQFSVRQGENALGLNVSPTGALTIL